MANVEVVVVGPVTVVVVEPPPTVVVEAPLVVVLVVLVKTFVRRTAGTTPAAQIAAAMRTARITFGQIEEILQIGEKRKFECNCFSMDQ